MLRGGRFGTPEQQRLPAGHDRRRAARGLRAVGGPGGVRHHRNHHAGQAGRRGVLADRGQGVDHPRLAGRLLHHLRPHQRRPDEGPLLPGARRRARPELRLPRAEDGADRLDHGVDVPGRRPGGRERRIGAEGQGMPIALAALDSGRLGIAACATGLAQAALDWPSGTRRSGSSSGAASPTSRASSSCWPRWPLRSTPLVPLSDGRPQAGRRPAVHPRRGGGQDGGHRCGDEGDDRRGAGAGRLRLHPGLPGGALHARGEGDPDLRRHQPDPAAGHRPPAAAARWSTREADRLRRRAGHRRRSGLGAAPSRPWLAPGPSVVLDLPVGRGGAGRRARCRVQFAAADVCDEDQVAAAVEAAASWVRSGRWSTVPAWRPRAGDRQTRRAAAGRLPAG